MLESLFNKVANFIKKSLFVKESLFILKFFNKHLFLQNTFGGYLLKIKNIRTDLVKKSRGGCVVLAFYVYVKAYGETVLL